MRRPQQPKKPEYKPSREDELHTEAVTHAAKRVVEHLRRAYAGRPHREIGNLKREEIIAITEDCVSAWCAKRLEQARGENIPIGKHDQFILGS